MCKYSEFSETDLIDPLVFVECDELFEKFGFTQLCVAVCHFLYASEFNHYSICRQKWQCLQLLIQSISQLKRLIGTFLELPFDFFLLYVRRPERNETSNARF